MLLLYLPLPLAPLAAAFVADDATSFLAAPRFSGLFALGSTRKSVTFLLQVLWESVFLDIFMGSLWHNNLTKLIGPHMYDKRLISIELSHSRKVVLQSDEEDFKHINSATIGNAYESVRRLGLHRCQVRVKKFYSKAVMLDY